VLVRHQTAVAGAVAAAAAAVAAADLHSMSLNVKTPPSKLYYETAHLAYH